MKLDAPGKKSLGITPLIGLEIVILQVEVEEIAPW